MNRHENREPQAPARGQMTPPDLALLLRTICAGPTCIAEVWYELSFSFPPPDTQFFKGKYQDMVCTENIISNGYCWYITGSVPGLTVSKDNTGTDEVMTPRT
ncbi:hypothetical protein J6590_078076 [Homalodisca vitripennis]|nr:hypothetical protein J6590_078076 [Homalodisca vitripennis]